MLAGLATRAQCCGAQAAFLGTSENDGEKRSLHRIIKRKLQICLKDGAQDETQAARVRPLAAPVGVESLRTHEGEVATARASTAKPHRRKLILGASPPASEGRKPLCAKAGLLAAPKAEEELAERSGDKTSKENTDHVIFFY